MSKREEKIFSKIGQVVVCGAIWISFVLIIFHGLMNATTLN